MIFRVPEIRSCNVPGSSFLSIKVDYRVIGELKKPGFDFIWGRNRVQILMGLDQNFLEKVFDICVIRDPGVQETPQTCTVFLPDAFQVHLQVLHNPTAPYAPFCGRAQSAVSLTFQNVRLRLTPQPVIRRNEGCGPSEWTLEGIPDAHDDVSGISFVRSFRHHLDHERTRQF